MKISKFNGFDIDLFREKCNFVGYEPFIFEMRRQGTSREDIAYELGMSVGNVDRISAEINRKITEVLEYIGRKIEF